MIQKSNRFPPPCLHIILGLANSTYDVIAEHHPNAAELWAKSVNATRHGQFGFAGRHCRALISKHGVLMEAGLTKYAYCMEKLLFLLEFCSSWTTYFKSFHNTKIPHIEIPCK